MQLHERNSFVKKREDGKVEPKKFNHKEYLELLESRVPLDKLYDIEASCHHTEGTDFCGLLVRIVDKKVLKINNGKPWLVQVWRRGGQLVFEKALKERIKNWNITQDKFLF